MANLIFKQAVQVAPSSTSTKGTLLTAAEVDGNLVSLNADIQTRMLKAGGTFAGTVNWNGIVTIASAATTDIGGAASNAINVTGGVTITSLGTAPPGAERTVIFSGSTLVLTNSSAIVMPYGVDVHTVAGDVAGFISQGSGNWTCAYYSRDLSMPNSDATTYWRGDKTFADFGAAVRGAVLTGLVNTFSSAVNATDTLIIALGKLQQQILLKQDILVSGSNIKTVNGADITGGGNVKITFPASAMPSNGARCAINSTYLIDGNSSSGFVFYMPAPVTVGDYVEFIDMNGNWNSGAWYVGYDSTGGKVMGLTENMLVNRANYNFKLVWSGATGGWRIV